MAGLPVAGPGDFRSHQEFADTLIGELAMIGVRNDVPYGEVCGLIQSLVRKDKWYEMAVLEDLLIMDHNHYLNSQFVKCWLVESFALQRHRPPYHVLIAMAYEWQKTNNERYRMFPPGNLPDVSERPRPPKPEWMIFFESKPPAGGRPLVEYLDQFVALLEMYPGECSLAHYNYYMALHEPNMLWYNVPLLHDLCKDDSEPERKARLLRYRKIAADSNEAYNRFRKRMLDNLEEAWERGVEMIAAGKKKQAVTDLLERLRKE